MRRGRTEELLIGVIATIQMTVPMVALVAIPPVRMAQGVLVTEAYLTSWPSTFCARRVLGITQGRGVPVMVETDVTVAAVLAETVEIGAVTA